MSKHAPIIIVDDDEDDKDMLVEIINELKVKNEVLWFSESSKALDYLNTTTKPVFLIFCDINMPKQNGLEFKATIDADPVLRHKSIPFLFYSTTATEEAVDMAYTKLTVQGFFIKGNNYSQSKQLIKTIFDYWQACVHPNTV